MSGVKPHVDIDGAQSASWLPYAQKQLQRLKRVRATGKEKIDLQTGTEITLWWGGIYDKIRIISKSGFEFLVDVLASPFEQLMGLKKNPSTSLYEPEVNILFDSHFPTPGGLPYTLLSGTDFSPQPAADKNHTTSLVLRNQFTTDWYVMRNKGSEITGPFNLAKAQPLTPGRVVTDVMGITGGVAKIRSFGVKETAEKVYPMISLDAFNARAVAAFPSPFVVGNVLFMIQSAASGGSPELLVWISFSVQNSLFTTVRLATYLERYSLDVTLVPTGVAERVGMSLIETISREESLASGRGPFGVVSDNFFTATPGSFQTAIFPCIIDNVGVPIVGRTDMSPPLNVGGVSWFPLAAGIYPTKISINFGSGDFPLLDETIAPGFSTPFQLMGHMFNQHCVAIRIVDDEYFFVDGVSIVTTPSDTGHHDLAGNEQYDGNGIWTFTFHHWVFKNGSLLSQSQEVRTYDNNSDSWDNYAPVSTFTPADGHRLNEADLFIGGVVTETPVNRGSWVNGALPISFSPAVFSADLGTQYVYPIATAQRIHGYFVGSYKGELFYIFALFNSGSFLPIQAYGVPVSDPTVAPILFGPDNVRLRTSDQVTTFSTRP